MIKTAKLPALAALTATLAITLVVASSCDDSDTTGATAGGTAGDTGGATAGTTGTTGTSGSTGTDGGSGGFTSTSGSDSGGFTTTSTSGTGSSSGATDTEGDTEGDTGADDGEIGEPGAQEFLYYVEGELDMNGDFSGQGALEYLQNDAMGVAQERCVITFTVAQVSKPTDCSSCTAAFETANSDVTIATDAMGGCAEAGWTEASVPATERWGVGMGETLYTSDGTSWTAYPEGEAFAEGMEVGFGKYDLGPSTMP